MAVESKSTGLARIHAALTSWLWGRVAVLLVAIPVAWITGSFDTGLVAALILLGGVFVGTNRSEHASSLTADPCETEETRNEDSPAKPQPLCRNSFRLFL